MNLLRQRFLVFKDLIKWKIHMNLKMIPWQHLATKIYQNISNMDKRIYLKIKTKKLHFWNKLFLKFSKTVKLLRLICKGCQFKLGGLKVKILQDRNNHFNSKICRIMRVFLLIILKMVLLFLGNKLSSYFQKIEIITLNIIDLIK